MSIDVTNTYTLPNIPTMTDDPPTTVGDYWGNVTITYKSNLPSLILLIPAKVHLVCIPIIFYSRTDTLPIVFYEGSTDLYPITFYEYVRRVRTITISTNTLPSLPQIGNPSEDSAFITGGTTTKSDDLPSIPSIDVEAAEV